MKTTELGSEARKLDLSLESLFLLREPRLTPGEYIDETGRSRLWQDSTNTRSQLTKWAEAGDVFAVEKLAEHLLLGSAKPELRFQGIQRLMQAAEMHSPFAMLALGDWLLDESDSEEARADGESWLRRASDSGYAFARLNRSIRLLQGDGLKLNAGEGEQLLCDSAAQGNRMAMLALGIRLLTGRNLASAPEQGQRWLRLAGAGKAEGLTNAALSFYRKGLNALTCSRQRWLAMESGYLFLAAMQAGDPAGGANLAYLIRRKEVPGTLFPSLDEILVPLVNAGHPLALINQALRLAAGVDCREDWRTADDLIAKVAGISSVLSWWLERARHGDPEGHLVTAWSQVHASVPDPDHLSIDGRMQLAKQGGWLPPEWLLTASLRLQH